MYSYQNQNVRKQQPYVAPVQTYDQRRSISYQAGRAYNAADKINILSLIKVIFVIMIIVVLYIFGKGITEKIKSAFGITGNIWNGFKFAGGNPEDKKKEAADKAAEIKAQGLPDLKSYSQYATISNVKVDPRPLVDYIADCMLTVWDYIPFSTDYDKINDLAKRNPSELRVACRYYEITYKTKKYPTIYALLKGQTGGSIDYEKLLNRLKSLGYVVPMKPLK